MKKSKKEKTMTNKLSFATREELQQYLIKLQKRLNEKGEFNIYVHQINSWQHGGGDKEQIIEGKVNGILNNGLSLYEYSSIFGTTIFLGSTNSDVSDAIIDYDYHHDSSYPTCVIAIPKFVNIDGKRVEYSSFKSNSPEAFQEINKAYRDEKLMPTTDHKKANLFDVVKGSSMLPVYYILGVKMEDEQGFSFVENSAHLMNSNDQEYQNYEEKVAEKICSAAKNFGTTNPIELMIKAYRQEEKWREDRLDDYD